MFEVKIQIAIAPALALIACRISDTPLARSASAFDDRPTQWVGQQIVLNGLEQLARPRAEKRPQVFGESAGFRERVELVAVLYFHSDEVCYTVGGRGKLALSVRSLLSSQGNPARGLPNWCEDNMLRPFCSECFRRHRRPFGIKDYEEMSNLC